MHATGTIIKARVNRFPFIYHYGTVLQIKGVSHVVHFSPRGYNLEGGSLFIDTIAQYTQTRKIVSTHETNLDTKKILTAIEPYKKQKFNIITNNCEHFAYNLHTGNAISPQLAKYSLIIVLLILVTTLIINNKIK